jgi:hypothetical protein
MKNIDPMLLMENSSVGYASTDRFILSNLSQNVINPLKPSGNYVSVILTICNDHFLLSILYELERLAG